MKIFTRFILACVISMTLTSCSSLKGKNEGTIGKSVKAEEKAHDKVDGVNEAIVQNDRQKLEVIGVFASGTDYALSKVPEPTKEVEVAREMNARVLNITGTPALDQLKSVHAMVDNLVSTLKEEKAKGLKQLANRDSEIYNIQLEKKALEQAKEQQIKKYMDVAQAAALKSDQYAATLGQLDSWWGLGAVFYGVKKFVTNSLLFLSIFAFIYLALRVASTMHPAAATAFKIFDGIASIFINLIKGLAPGAAKMAKLIPEATYNVYKETLGHIVDNIELMKIEDKKAIAAGQPLKKYTLDEILTAFNGSMDQSHKDVVSEVKVQQNWK